MYATQHGDVYMSNITVLARSRQHTKFGNNMVKARRLNHKMYQDYDHRMNIKETSYGQHY